MVDEREVLKLCPLRNGGRRNLARERERVRARAGFGGLNEDVQDAEDGQKRGEDSPLGG